MRYVVEFTNSDKTQPKQITVDASSPEGAIAKACMAARLEGFRFIEPYTKKTDPGNAYEGWGWAKISVELAGY